MEASNNQQKVDDKYKFTLKKERAYRSMSFGGKPELDISARDIKTQLNDQKNSTSRLYNAANL